MLTGEKIELFLDRDDISWGEDWRKKIDESLSSISFFIPILTPRYFMSFECRRELQFFARRAKALGIEELVLPLLYVDVASLHEDVPTDDLVALVKLFQWEDWRELKFSDVDSSEYRRGVARLAERLVEANMRAEEANVAAAALELETSTEDGDDSPGVLDRLAIAEETLPQWQTTLETISEEITRIGRVVQESAEEMEKADAKGGGFAARLTIARKLSQRMREPSERIWSFGNEFASQLHQVDTGIRAMIEQASVEAHESPESRADICTFFNSVQEMSVATHEGLGAIESMVDSISPVEAMSRDLRAPLRRLRQGLTLMLEARGVADEWVRLIEDTSIDCDDTSTDSMVQSPESREREVRDLD
jgi:hypothetical protein